MSNLCIMGVDPGLSGAIAFCFSAYPKIISVDDMPVIDGRVNPAAIADLVERMRPDGAVIELVGAMPGQGVSSMFRFGHSFGTVCGVVSALRVPVHYVSPVKWKRHFGLSKDKEESRRRATELWPDHASLFARKKDDGRAEAALLARYGVEKIFHSPTNAGGRGAAGEGGGNVTLADIAENVARARAG